MNMRTRDVEDQQSVRGKYFFSDEGQEHTSGDLLRLKREYVCPTTVLEKTLAEIWSQVLHIPHIGIHHNFFDLGGTALQSLEIHCLAREEGINFSVQQFHRHPTIYELSQAVLGTLQGEEER